MEQLDAPTEGGVLGGREGIRQKIIRNRFLIKGVTVSFGANRLRFGMNLFANLFLRNILTKAIGCDIIFHVVNQ